MPAALIALHEFAGGQSIDYLRNVVGLTPSGTVRLVDRLAAAGLVARRDGVDGRTLSVVLTARGRRVAAATLAARARVLDELLDELDPAARAGLTVAAEALLGSITDGREAARHICRMCDGDACGHHEGRCPVTRAADAAEATA